MKTFLKYLGIGLLVVLLGLALAAYWFLYADTVPEPDLPGRMEAGVLEHDGYQRHWQAYVPASKAEAPALVIVYHGSTGDGSRIRSGTFYGFDVQAERHGFVVAYPDGVQRHWNDCRTNASYAANQLNIDDVGFTRALVAKLADDYGIDPRRVFVAGMSNGGHMVYRLAYEAPDLIAAAVAFSANLPVDGNNACEQRQIPVPMMMIVGTEDAISPYQGGIVGVGGDESRGEVLSAEASARYWAQLAGYTGSGERRNWPDKLAEDGTEVQSLSWSSPGKPSVELVTVVGGGHVIPHPVFRLPRILGRTSHEFDATELAWTFFASTP